jgi:hypothetical protein
MSNIHTAMVAIMRDITAIGKDSKNQAQGFKFRGIDAVYNELHNLLAKHGVITLPQAGTPVVEERTNSKGTTLRFVTIPMTYQFVAEDGSSITCQVIGEGMDSGDKATNKAMAIAHKYALLQTFLIPTEDLKDPDYETHEVVPVKAKPVIAKPVIPAKVTMKQVNPDLPAKSVEVTRGDISEGTRMPQNALDMLFSMMTTNRLEEDDILAFCASKGMKAPEYVSDLPDAAVNRLVAVFDEVVEFAINR